MENMTVKNLYAGTIKVRAGHSPKQLYEHQVKAMAELNSINRKNDFSTMVVLPTGAGKTLTAVLWLLTNAVDKSIKVLWIAHRHLLLEQAADTFTNNAFQDNMLNKTDFNYRLVSGKHDISIHIRQSDDVLIASKDSIISNLTMLSDWLKSSDSLFLVIDEAHHATAKSYRRIIDFLKARKLKLKIIGLTATPFRTSENEQGLLGKIFTDGIVYKIDLDTLIKKGILSTPICESSNTETLVGDQLGLKAIQSIEKMDIIPEDIAEYLANNKERNRFIVDKYIQNENYKKYGQTLVFAVNREHAFALRALFEKRGEKQGIKAGVIVSGTSADFIGIDVSNKENDRQINLFKDGKIQVLINVNILTEGADLPKTHTVFLTRPTISMVLMTQMIGRALRGEKAGGTKEAYIVSFIDDWKNKVNWVTPDNVLFGESIFIDKTYEQKKRLFRVISIEKLEEFARIADASVDTRRLEAIPFVNRIPIGMYVFSFIDKNGLEHYCQILLYDNSKEKYEELISALPSLFLDRGIVEEQLSETELHEMVEMIEMNYFDFDMLPPYNPHDIENLLRYFAQKEVRPSFLSFEEIDRKKVDLSQIAQHIVDTGMGRTEQSAYINSLWNDETSMIQVYFTNRYFFNRQLDIELDKVVGDFVEPSDVIVISGEVDITELPLYEIMKLFPQYFHELRDKVFLSSQVSEGVFQCNICKKRSEYKGQFQMDHIIPRSKGGKAVELNMQLLCNSCNKKKGNRT